LKEIGVDKQIIIKKVSKELVGKAYIGLIWLRIWTSGGHPWLRC